MSDKYLLDGHLVIPCENLMYWAKWFETANRRVALTKKDSFEVSTVFLGLDHNFGHSGPPLLFETMVFGGPLDQEQERYSTWEEAKVGHKSMVKKALAQKSHYTVQPSEEQGDRAVGG
jgi:hypothetical protein